MKEKNKKTMPSILLRFNLLCMLFVLVIFSMVGVTTWRQIMGVTSTVCARMGLPVTEKAAAILDGDKFEELSRTKDAGDPYYEAARLSLLDLRNRAGCRYLYTMAPVTGTRYQYVIDGSGEPGEETFSPLGAEDDVAGYDAAFFRTMEEGVPQFGNLDYQKEWGWVISTYSPIRNSRGKTVGIIGCDFDAGRIYTMLRPQILRQAVLPVFFIFVGLAVYGLLFNGINRLAVRLVDPRGAAGIASRAKSDFLTNISHEIRTPMNTILGMAELILRRDLSADMREEVQGIKLAGSNLLSIINNVLDFSNIESGRLEIVPRGYPLAPLINDVITITKTRFLEKPVLFIADIDSTLPARLEGDEIRVRQILLNLLSNAVKYTRQGYIVFTVTGESGAEGRVTLRCSVEDTGIGIKEEDMGEIFGHFVQVDTRANRGIEGTGLGLAVSRGLCLLMGGDITVESRYGEGSVFTATMTQKVLDARAFAAVENPGAKAVLIQESRKIYAESLARTLNGFAVPFYISAGDDDFFRQLKKGTYSFAFIHPGSAELTIEILRKQNLSTRPVLLADMGEIASFKTIPIIGMPAYAVSIANILNGVSQAGAGGRQEFRFIAPDAHVLIVDDIVTNLNVAKGLLAPYHMDIQTCTRGSEALELLRRRRFDLVLMDHLMPDMDGVEVVAAIRAMEDETLRNIPVIVLTASAYPGIQDMFLEKGFDDYLAKPLEIGKLNEVMERWIPRAKWISPAVEARRDSPSAGSPSGGSPAAGTLTAGTSTAGDPGMAGSAPYIEGLDTRRGIAMTGGTLEGYWDVLEIYHRDAEDRLRAMETWENQGLAPEGIPAFTIQAHALKSASASIGAAALSAAAAELEAAGRRGDREFIQKNLGTFRRSLGDALDRVDEALFRRAALRGKDAPRGKDAGGAEARDPADGPAASRGPGASRGPDPESAGHDEIRRLFLDLKAALEAENIEDIDRCIGDLDGLPLSDSLRKIHADISDNVLMSEFSAAIAVLDAWLDA
jgi:signal transduction histidine kinase/CheY-like chemotaxis protein